MVTDQQVRRLRQKIEMRRITAIVAIFGLLAVMFYPILAIASPAAG